MKLVPQRFARELSIAAAAERQGAHAIGQENAAEIAGLPRDGFIDALTATACRHLARPSTS